MATLSNDYSQLPYLSPTQQGLLLAALSSNKRSTPDPASSSSQSLTGPQKSLQSTTASKHQQAVTETIDPTMFNSSLSGSVNVRNSLNATSYPGFVTDLDFGFADNGNDFTDDFGDFANDFDADGEVGEKRKNSDASDEEELGNKRREGGDDKTTKKAGRKPLTSEPTTVRWFDFAVAATVANKHGAEAKGAKQSRAKGVSRTKGEASQGPGAKGGRS